MSSKTSSKCSGKCNPIRKPEPDEGIEIDGDVGSPSKSSRSHKQAICKKCLECRKPQSVTQIVTVIKLTSKHTNKKTISQIKVSKEKVKKPVEETEAEGFSPTTPALKKSAEKRNDSIQEDTSGIELTDSSKTGDKTDSSYTKISEKEFVSSHEIQLPSKTEETKPGTVSYPFEVTDPPIEQKEYLGQETAQSHDNITKTKPGLKEQPLDESYPFKVQSDNACDNLASPRTEFKSPENSVEDIIEKKHIADLYNADTGIEGGANGTPSRNQSPEADAFSPKRPDCKPQCIAFKSHKANKDKAKSCKKECKGFSKAPETQDDDIIEKIYVADLRKGNVGTDREIKVPDEKQISQQDEGQNEYPKSTENLVDDAYTPVPEIQHGDVYTKAPEIQDDEAYTTVPEIQDDDAFATALEIQDDDAYTTVPEIQEDDAYTTAREIQDDDAYTTVPEIQDDDAYTTAREIQDDDAYTTVPEIQDDDVYAKAPEIKDGDAYTKAPEIEDDDEKMYVADVHEPDIGIEDKEIKMPFGDDASENTKVCKKECKSYSADKKKCIVFTKAGPKPSCAKKAKHIPEDTETIDDKCKKNVCKATPSKKSKSTADEEYPTKSSPENLAKGEVDPFEFETDTTKAQRAEMDKQEEAYVIPIDKELESDKRSKFIPSEKMDPSEYINETDKAQRAEQAIQDQTYKESGDEKFGDIDFPTKTVQNKNIKSESEPKPGEYKNDLNTPERAEYDKNEQLYNIPESVEKENLDNNLKPTNAENYYPNTKSEKESEGPSNKTKPALSSSPSNAAPKTVTMAEGVNPETELGEGKNKIKRVPSKKIMSAADDSENSDPQIDSTDNTNSEPSPNTQAAEPKSSQGSTPKPDTKSNLNEEGGEGGDAPDGNEDDEGDPSSPEQMEEYLKDLWEDFKNSPYAKKLVAAGILFVVGVKVAKECNFMPIPLQTYVPTRF